MQQPCRLPPGPWQHFQPESLDGVYTDGDPAFWPDTSGNGRDIDGVIVGGAKPPAPYRPNLLNGYGGITLQGADFNDYDAGTYYTDRDTLASQVVGDAISIVMVCNVTTDFTSLWAAGGVSADTGWELNIEAGGVMWSAIRSGSSSLFSSGHSGWKVISASINETTQRLWVNGVEVETGAGRAGPWDHLWTLYYGGSGVTEWVIYPFDLTVEQHEDVWCALSKKYGLS